MSFFVTTSRIIKSTFQHLVRNPYHTLAAILVMTLTFFVTSVFILAALGSNVILKYFENKPQVTAFFKDETSEDYINQLKNVIEETGKASNVKYVSKTEALTIYKRQNVNEPELLEFVTADILPASLEISANKIEYLNDLANLVASDARVEKVIYQREVVESLRSWSEKLRIGGIILIGFLAVVSFLIILVVISMNIASFGKEIEIMKLVGASSWYVRWPFILDGIIYGLISASISSLFLFLLLPKVSEIAAGLITGITIFPQSGLLILDIWGVMLLAGTLLGIVGSVVAIGRHLKV